MNELQFRPFEQGDEKPILQLFSTSYRGRIMSGEYWKWRFQENPSGRHMIELAWDAEILAAHYAVSPVILTSQGQDFLTALSVTTMTHPNYRGRSLFPLLAERLYQRLESSGFAAVWGFPNRNSHRGFVRALGWHDMYEIPMFKLPLAGLNKAPRRSERIVEVAKVDQQFDDLWEEISPSYKLAVRRDSKYLQWRFRANPVVAYRILCHAAGPRISGYTVFSVYQEKEVQIVDLLTIPDKAVGIELVLAVVDIALAARADEVRMWLPVFDPLHPELEQMGFRHAEPLTYLGARPFRGGQSGLDLLDARRWHFMLSDSDVY